LVKICEGKPFVTTLQRFLLDHSLLILELGFHPLLDPSCPYGFDVEHSLPTARWLRRKQQTCDQTVLQTLLQATVHALQAEIPGLGETVAVDVKHLYAWVRHNNPHQFVPHRYDLSTLPTGDPDCRLGVKRSTNQEQADGIINVNKEYLWGYGSGVVAAITRLWRCVSGRIYSAVQRK